MISALFIQNSNGDVLVSRIFKEEIKPTVHSIFFKKIVTADPKKLKNPILTIGSTSFIHLKKDDVYYVAVSRYNIDVTVVMQYLVDLIELITLLLSNGNPVYDINIMDNVLPIHEILDLSLDQGYVNTENMSASILSKIESPIHRVKASKLGNSEYEILNDHEELNALLQLNPLTISNDDQVQVQINEFIHVPVNGKIKVIGELLAVSSHIPLALKISSEVKSHDIHSFILSPRVKSVDGINEIYLEIDESVTCLLNYHGYCQLSQLPIVIVGSIKQFDLDKFYLEVSIIINRYDIEINNLSIKLPIPNIASDVNSVYGSVNIIGDELCWEFTNLRLADFKDNYDNRITLKQDIIVDPSCNLTEWLSSRNDTLITYDTEDLNVLKFDVLSYKTNNSENKFIKNKVFLTNEIKI